MTSFLTELPGLLAVSLPQVHGADPTRQRIWHVDKLGNRSGWSLTDAFLPPSSAGWNRGEILDSEGQAVEAQDCTIGADAVICMAAAALSAAGGLQEAAHVKPRKIAITKSLFRKPTLRKENPSISARIVMGSATHA